MKKTITESQLRSLIRKEIKLSRFNKLISEATTKRDFDIMGGGPKAIEISEYEVDDGIECYVAYSWRNVKKYPMEIETDDDFAYEYFSNCNAVKQLGYEVFNIEGDDDRGDYGVLFKKR